MFIEIVNSDVGHPLFAIVYRPVIYSRHSDNTGLLYQLLLALRVS